jgi:hypothetical protein
VRFASGIADSKDSRCRFSIADARVDRTNRKPGTFAVRATKGCAHRSDFVLEHALHRFSGCCTWKFLAAKVQAVAPYAAGKREHPMIALHHAAIAACKSEHGQDAVAKMC